MQEKQCHSTSLREAHLEEFRLDFSRPTFDNGPSDARPHLIHVELVRIASLYISGWFWERLTPRNVIESLPLAEISVLVEDGGFNVAVSPT